MYLQDNDHTKWDENIQQIRCAIRFAVHEITGYSPNSIIFSRDLPMTGKASETNETAQEIDCPRS